MTSQADHRWKHRNARTFRILDN